MQRAQPTRVLFRDLSQHFERMSELHLVLVAPADKLREEHLIADKLHVREPLDRQLGK